MAGSKEKKRKPIYKRWWAYPAALIILFIIIGATSNGGSNTPSKNSVAVAAGASNGSSGTPAKTSKNTTSHSKKPTTTSKKPTLPGVGTAVKVGKLVYDVKSVSYTHHLNDGGTGLAPSANGGEWLVISVAVTNDDTSARTISDSLFTLHDGDVKYSASGDADMAINSQSSFLFSQLNPGLTQKGLIAFNVPKQAHYQLEVDSGLFAASNALIQL